MALPATRLETSALWDVTHMDTNIVAEHTSSISTVREPHMRKAALSTAEGWDGVSTSLKIAQFFIHVDEHIISPQNAGTYLPDHIPYS
jgi:hypothetical protein